MKAILNNRVLQHIVFWCFYVLIYTGNYSQNGKYAVELLITFILLPFHLLFTYAQLYFLIPRFLLKKKIISYVLITIIFTKIIDYLSYIVFTLNANPIRLGLPHPVINWSFLWTFHFDELKAVFSLFMICGVAVSIKLLKKWYFENERNEKIEKEKLSMELEMLKAQVHPHFLFNTLNNLYSLTLIHSEKAPIVVTHLSDLLRYMLYECNEKEVPLENEIGILKKYVELEKLRYGSRIDVSFSCSGSIKENLIAPLILIPFVENSFKHGMSEQLDQCWVNLHLYAEGNNFTFNLSNSFRNDIVKPITGGIGLQNIKKRLELIYAGKYNLAVNEDEDMFIVKLQLQLNPVIPITVVNTQSIMYKTNAAV